MHRFGPVVLLVMAGLATAADEIPLDEVLVQGLRAQLRELRREAVELEERFYARYNELNTVRDFDVHCHADARTGTLLKGRICRAVYESKAFAEEGREAFQYRQFILEQVKAGRPDPMPPGPPPPPAVMSIEVRRPAFQQNMREVVARDEELIRLLHDRTEAVKQYDALRRQLFRPGSKE